MTEVKQQLVLIYVILGTVLLSFFLPVDWQFQARILRDCVIFAWAVGIVNLAYLGGGLNKLLGIRPRSLSGVVGIVMAPLLHRSAGHLIANTLPFVIFGWMVMLQGVQNFYAVSLLIILISGVGTWLIGRRDVIHLGASGLMFGYLGYLITRGQEEVILMALGLCFVVMLLYGDRFWTLMPDQDDTALSWESHLFGFLGGVIAGYSPIALDQISFWLSSYLS
ncbi:MAG: rhomboid family intramembrane serine protease [Cyanobacteria bacterium J06628_6]